MSPRKVSDSNWRLNDASVYTRLGFCTFRLDAFLTSHLLCVAICGLSIHSARSERRFSTYRWLRQTFCSKFTVDRLSHVLKLSFTPLQALIFMSFLNRVTSTRTLRHGLSCKCFIGFRNRSAFLVPGALQVFIIKSVRNPKERSLFLGTLLASCMRSSIFWDITPCSR
jgi:hypothetical protein